MDSAPPEGVPPDQPPVKSDGDLAGLQTALPDLQPAGADLAAGLLGASGWVQPNANPWLSTRAHPALAAIVWVTAGLLLAMAGWTAANGQEAASSPWRIGYVAGTIAGGLGFATALRWAWLRVRRTTTHHPGLRSTWIPAVGALLAMGMLATAFSQAVAPPPPQDPATLFHVGPGYSLAEGDPATEEQFRNEFEKQPIKPRAMASTSIVANDGSVGLLVVMDMAVIDLSSELTLQGMIVGAGGDANPRRETVAGRSTMFASAQGITIVGWVDAPLIAILYAVDDPTARAMAASVILAND